jgi:parallel beta-helix repeat protein
LLLGILANVAVTPIAPADETGRVTRIDRNFRLEPNRDYGRIVVTASNITIDGAGVVLKGSDAEGNKRSGTAITASGVHNVTLKNCKASGWETGLQVIDGSGWKIVDCDFSDNFHDPDFGWGENGRRGGIVLQGVTESLISNCRANRVWDACVLVDSHRNTLRSNDFSHTSNTCLKLWHSSENQVFDNDLSYGIRRRPDEVHARDSTGVLIENGSNRNHFAGNDCRYGGDGIFVRVLNGWCSTDNVFVNNDCSYANNNGFECWAPRNFFFYNRANHCSYGFWLGGSDQTRLVGNEASYNGLQSGNHNSPHLPNRSHAGIVFMFGPSSHVLLRDNRCIGNNGAGIALIGDQPSKGKKWKAYHWVIENNTLAKNRWGVFAQYADWITLAGNHMRDNRVSDLQADQVNRLQQRTAPPANPQDNIDSSNSSVESPIAPEEKIHQVRIDDGRWPIEVAGPVSSQVGQPVHWSLTSESLDLTRFEEDQIVWDFADPPGDKSSIASGPDPTHTFTAPGFYRVGVTLDDRELAFRDFYVTPAVPEFAASADMWSFNPESNLHCQFTDDLTTKVVDESAVRVDVKPYHGGWVKLRHPIPDDLASGLSKDHSIGFWWRARNPNLPGWQNENPRLTFRGSDGKTLRLLPREDLLQNAANNEAREGWRFFQVPIGGDEIWKTEGELSENVSDLTIALDSWGGDPMVIWLDGLHISIPE